MVGRAWMQLKLGHPRSCGAWQVLHQLLTGRLGSSPVLRRGADPRGPAFRALIVPVQRGRFSGSGISCSVSLAWGRLGEILRRGAPVSQARFLRGLRRDGGAGPVAWRRRLGYWRRPASCFSDACWPSGGCSRPVWRFVALCVRGKVGRAISNSPLVRSLPVMGPRPRLSPPEGRGPAFTDSWSGL